MAKTKKTETPTDDTIVMEVMPGADPISEEDAKPFEVDLNFENTDSTEGEEIEEESETELTTTPEEMEAKAGEQEETTEPAETEVAEEETVVAESKSDTQEPVPTDEGQVIEPEVETKAPMVPKSRLDEVLAKQKALQKKLDLVQAEKEIAPEAPSFDFVSKEAEYQDLVLNAETEKAVALRSEIRQAEKAQMMHEVRQEMGSTVQQNQDLKDLQVKALELEAKHEVLNENSEIFSPELQQEVIELRDAFITQGYVPVDALTKATNYVMGANAPVAPAPEPVNTVVEQKQKATVARKVQASQSQPPSLKGEGVNAKKENKIDLTKLSSEEFDALPAETLRRMRGDFG